MVVSIFSFFLHFNEYASLSATDFTGAHRCPTSVLRRSFDFPLLFCVRYVKTRLWVVSSDWVAVVFFFVKTFDRSAKEKLD